MRLLLVAAAVLAIAGSARAEDPVQISKGDRADISLTLGLRAVHPFSGPEKYAQHLLDYGYGSMGALLDVSVAGSYRVHRYVDVGARLDYLFGNAGSIAVDGAKLTLDGIEAVAFVRPFLHGKSDRAGAGLELAAGIQGGWVLLRGEAVARTSLVIAPTIVAVMSPTRVQPTLRFGPIFAHLRDAIAGHDLPTGGLVVTFGGNLTL